MTRMSIPQARGTDTCPVAHENALPICSARRRPELFPRTSQRRDPMSEGLIHLADHDGTRWHR
jgi:hypothetical protein